MIQKLKIKLVGLLAVLALLPACGGMDFPMQAAVVGAAMVANKMSKALENMTTNLTTELQKAIAKAMICGMAPLSEYVELSDTETDIEFYNEILTISKEKSSTSDNFLEHIGQKNEERLQTLIIKAYENSSKKFEREVYLKLAIKGLVHISQQTTDKKGWMISEVFKTEAYSEEQEKNVETTFSIAVLIPLDAWANVRRQDMGYKSYCLDNI